MKGLAIGAVFAAQAVQAPRRRIKHSLGEAEAAADSARATLEQTESALRTVRHAI